MDKNEVVLDQAPEIDKISMRSRELLQLDLNSRGLVVASSVGIDGAALAVEAAAITKS